MGLAPSVSDVQPAKPATADLERLKGVFLATLSHEIRTPLSGILGMVDLLGETQLDDEQREYLAATRLCAESLFQLLNASLQYSAISTGQVHVENTEFALREVIDSALHLTKAKADAKDLNLISRFAPNVPETCIGDALKIQEILLVLLDNAAKFTHHGSIEIEVKMDRTSVPALSISVRDTGIGIAPEDKERIFASFEQLDSGQARAYPGIGLGLALAAKLASLMNGGIWVESELGVGSTFTVRIPVGLPAAVSVSAHPGESASHGDRQPLILAVEDNPTGMMVLRHALRRHPVQVESATDGRSAVAAAARCRFDLILMDLQMPDMTGLEAAEAIRKLPNYENVPILALTADISDQTRHECLNRGMQDFLSKPIDGGALWTAIGRHLKSGPAQQSPTS